jgi:hypothetical protein
MAKREETSSTSNRDRTWRYLQHADNLIHSRQSFTLVAESMLVVAFFTVGSDPRSNQFLHIVIAALGVVYTLAWLYTNQRLATRMRFLNNDLYETDPIYKKYIDAVPKELSSQTVLVRILPLLTLVFWLILIFYSICA